MEVTQKIHLLKIWKISFEIVTSGIVCQNLEAVDHLALTWTEWLESKKQTYMQTCKKHTGKHI